MYYQSSKVGTLITDLRRSTHRSSVFEGQHIHLRRSTHRSSKVDTSISEGRHSIDLRRALHDLRRATYRSLKVDTSIIESRRIDLRRSNAETPTIRRRISNAETPTIRRRILSTTALLSPWSRRSYTRSYVYTCIYI